MSNKGPSMKDDENGSWQGYPRDLFIQALKDTEDEATTAEITDSVGCSRETTRLRMHGLEEDGLVESRKIGSTLVWELV